MLYKIEEFLLNRQTSTIIFEIQSYLQAWLKFKLPRHEIRRILKEDLRYSINKISSRTIKHDLKKLLSWRVLFWIKFIKLFDDNVIIANIDECDLNHKIGRLYSWVPKGSEAELKTLPFVDSKSMILWMLSNDYYFWSIVESNINKASFVNLFNI